MKLITILLFFMITASNAQDLSTHQWEERILLIFTGDTTDIDYKRQIAELSTEGEGLKDRKLAVYQVTPTKAKRGFAENGEWKENSEFYKKHKSTSSAFEVVLIGLDGGKKLTETAFLPPEKIFSVIDGMPMRKAEMRKNDKSENVLPDHL